MVPAKQRRVAVKSGEVRDWWLAHLFENVGRGAVRFLEHVARFSEMVGSILRTLPHPQEYFKQTPEQLVNVGNRSLPIVLLTATFSGMVTSVQTAYQITGFVPLYVVGSVVGESMVLELGPVITALVLAGRVGAYIAAELGTMRVTEQIDALESLAINPIGFLVIPKVIASVIMLPVLTVLADVVGIAGGWLVSVYNMNLTTTEFFKGFRMFFVPWDLFYGLIKAVFFGLTISLVSCYIGFCAHGGAEGVGKATTHAVVVSCLIILVLDYVLATILL
ncbi:MAG: ABC transporter permease [Calditrichaeota bacterium]|nr:MAG: ABC transporter permease [Calditrichota bacterium]